MALLVSPLILLALLFWGDAEWALSGALGIGMSILNLYISGLLIGRVAEKSPRLLMPVAMATFVLGLMLLTLIAVALRAADVVYFPVTGFTLIGVHLLVVLLEAAGIPDKIFSTMNLTTGRKDRLGDPSGQRS